MDPHKCSGQTEDPQAKRKDRLEPAPKVEGYEQLQRVLDRAYDQAARGKGAERHADGKPFHEQPMQQIADRHGLGFILGQAAKKIEEGHGMQRQGLDGPAVREMLGAIVYLAGGIIWMERNPSSLDPKPWSEGLKNGN